MDVEDDDYRDGDDNDDGDDRNTGNEDAKLIFEKIPK